MTDYYPLIAKTVTGLNAQIRHTLYQRGRNVLLTELEAVIPPLRKSIISKELLAFEEAIRRVEAELTRHPQDSEWPG
jgi:hypothetical protein